MLTITMDPHPLLHAICFTTHFPMPIGELPQPEWLTDLLKPEPTLAPVPLAPVSEEYRKSIRQLLRFGGFKPSGRSKPASEYLVRAANANELPPINGAVDVLNAVSLHGGMAIGVIDLNLCRPPLHIAIGQPGEHYVFNASGQDMELKGLICLYDQDGPCANPVKDSQRTKTNPSTTDTLTIMWGSNDDPQRTIDAASWYRQLLSQLGASTEDAEVRVAERPQA
ncbi:hypothetical protein IJT17_09885 [bacterium]|nr:hypothetical protein [bacterium]